MSYFMFDVEADGPCPHVYSMVCFGVVLVADTTKTFYGQTYPISQNYKPESLAISGFTRQQHEHFPLPGVTMPTFLEWAESVNEKGTKMVLASDNTAWDYQWLNYYLWRWCKRNPFGHSARNINDVFHGMKMDMRASFKHLRKTNHDHNPINDSMGNVEALLAMQQQGLKIKL